MYVIEIAQYPDRKRKAIVVYDHEKPNVRYIIGYINHNEELFKQALVDSRNVVYLNEEEYEQRRKK